MTQLVAGFGSSHSIMLASQREDWQHGFRVIDQRNPHLFDRAGNKTHYAELLAAAPATAQGMVSIDAMGQRFDDTQAAMDTLRQRIHAARLDVLIVIGDDQTELFRSTNLPAIAIYHGTTIRNAAAELRDTDNWVQRARMWRQEPGADRDHPVDSALAEWLIRQLSDRDFDIAAMSGLEAGLFEGHAFSFIHRRYLEGLRPPGLPGGSDVTGVTGVTGVPGATGLPIVPIILNTFDPPNQPTPRRCVALGAALRELITRYPGDQRVGVLASGGLSHFVVDEELDQGVIDAIRRKDSAWFAALDPRQLQAGSSEIRNWIVGIEALKDLQMDWVRYIPGYRSPALTGTGLCFAAWG